MCVGWKSVQMRLNHSNPGNHAGRSVTETGHRLMVVFIPQIRVLWKYFSVDENAITINLPSLQFFFLGVQLKLKFHFVFNCEMEWEWFRFGLDRVARVCPSAFNTVKICTIILWVDYANLFDSFILKPPLPFYAVYSRRLDLGSGVSKNNKWI